MKENFLITIRWQFSAMYKCTILIIIFQENLQFELQFIFRVNEISAKNSSFENIFFLKRTLCLSAKVSCWNFAGVDSDLDFFDVAFGVVMWNHFFQLAPTHFM